MRHLIQRMIEWRNSRGAIQWLAGGKNLARLALRRNIARENLAIIAQRLNRAETQHILAASDFVARFANAQASFARNAEREFFLSLRQQFARAIQNFVALKPCQLRTLRNRRANCLLHSLASNHRDRTNG